MFSSLLAISCLMALSGQLPDVFAAPIGLFQKESFGLESVDDFCRGDGRLDDYKDLAKDVYQRKTGRFYVVR